VLKTGVEEAYKAGDEIMEDITQRTDELFTKWTEKTEELFEKSMTEFKRIHKEIRFERWICFLAVVLSLICALLTFWMTR
jgi:preprotein translocase subunit SecE